MVKLFLKSNSAEVNDEEDQDDCNRSGWNAFKR